MMKGGLQLLQMAMGTASTNETSAVIESTDQSLDRQEANTSMATSIKASSSKYMYI